MNFPILENQKSLWMKQMQNPANPGANLLLFYHLTGKLDEKLLIQSIDLLFQTNPILYTIFNTDLDKTNCEINQFKIDVKVELISGSTHNSVINIIRENAEKFSRIPFDISKGPLFRIKLQKENDENYYLIAVFHHLIFDGESRKIFISSLLQIYQNLLEGSPVLENLKPGSKLLEILPGNNLIKETSTLIDFWKNYLDGAKSSTRLPLDYARKQGANGIGSREHFSIGKEISSKISELVNSKKSSLFRVLTSIIGLVFLKYSGDSDICIGVPYNLRKRNNDLADLIGYFVETTVVRLKIKEDQLLSDYLLESENQILAALKNSSLPFRRLVEIINPERKANINPIFQVAISWHDDFNSPVEKNEILAQKMYVEKGVSQFDITIYLWQNDSQIEGEIEYDDGLFQEGTIRRLIQNINETTEIFTKSLEHKLSELSFASKYDLDIQKEFNNNKRILNDPGVVSMINSIANDNANKIALIQGEEKLTYGQLNITTNKFANYLVDNNFLEQGDIVGVCMDRTIETIITLLSILKAGCAYLPLDPEFPRQRLNYIIKDSNARIIISKSKFASLINQDFEGEVILYDKVKTTIENSPAIPIDWSGGTNKYAYMIYTSGSTGTPKGVRIEHKSLVNLVNSMRRKPGVTSDDNLLAVVTFSFDMSVFEIFNTLSVGAQLIIAGSDQMNNGSEIIDLIDYHDITLLQATPSFWNMLIEAGWKGKHNLKAITGGESISSSLATELLKRVSELWNCYGPTEATVYVSVSRVTDAYDVNIGKPLDNTSISIIDNNNQILPIGAIGEIAVSGIGVAEEYHQRPDLSRKKFITLKDGCNYYRTGDLGRLRSDGNIDIIGRLDNQIKISGYRVEPGEIELCIEKMEGIKESVVLAEEITTGDIRLVAYVLKEKDALLEYRTIRNSLSKDLPKYMLPSIIYILDEFPKTPNGKVDKSALNVLYYNSKSINTDVSEPQIKNEIEKQVLEIWANVLKHKEINVFDNFFDIGGNSLLLVQLQTRLEDHFNMKLSLRSLFEIQNLRELADHIEMSILSKSSKGDKDGPDSDNIVKGEF